MVEKSGGGMSLVKTNSQNIIQISVNSDLLGFL